MKKIILIVCALLLSAGLAQGKETLKIGLMAPLTGDVKTFGESSKNGFYIALEDLKVKTAAILIAQQIREKAVKSVLIGTDGWDSPQFGKNSR